MPAAGSWAKVPPAMSEEPKTRARRRKKKTAKPVDEAPPPEETKRAPEPGPSEDPGARKTRLIRGSVITGLGFGATFLMMANAEQLPRGPLWGLLAMLVGTAGVLDLLGLWTEGADADRTPLRETALFALEGEPLWMSPVVTVPLALVIMVGGGAALGYDALPYCVIAGGAVLLLSAIRRPYVMAIAVATLLLLPFLGTYGLWDPWETHYGEVAREMLSRDDWISLWWAQEDWFWSKPILIFWMEALSMGAFGVDFQPDANPAHPEWAIRFPHFLLVLGVMTGVYALVSKRWSKRAGLLACVVLCTMPHFFFLSHQAITDMPFVANMTLAMCLLGIAVTTDPDAEVKRFSIGPLTLSARHALIAGLTLIVIPQVLYLMSRNLTFTAEMPPFGWHGDLFMFGSAGNHGVPGNSPVRNQEPFVGGPGAQPITQGLIWLCAYLGLLWILKEEKRGQSLAMFGFYVFCGLAFMAKGIPGFALPGLVALFWLVASKRWSLLGDGKLRVGAGILTVITVGLPWYVAMYIRHGPPFTDRLLIHDHINRLTAGVHMDESRAGSIGYFVEQMGYGLFPWIALAPIALALWFGIRRRGEPTTREHDQRQIMLLIALWLASAFTLFSAMTTKFHHYIFPCVPPAAILVGLAVDKLLDRPREGLDLKRLGVTALALIAPAPMVLGVAGIWGDVRGIIPEGVEGDTSDWVLAHPWSEGASFGLIALGVALLGGAIALGRSKPEERKSVSWSQGALASGLLAGPPVLALVGRDLSWVTAARPQGYERLIHLFVYNYGRPWPEHLDYRPILTGFAIVATCVVLLAAWRPVRDVAVRAFLGVALAFCVWSLDVYMIDLSPHWGQRELVQTYYDARTSADEPLVAYQMNWKGENFYTGNRVSVFVQLDNRALREWVSSNAGRTAFFMTERSRLNNLRGVLRGGAVEELTDDRFCNKFILVRVRIPGGGEGTETHQAPEDDVPDTRPPQGT